MFPQPFELNLRVENVQKLLNPKTTNQKPQTTNNKSQKTNLRSNLL
jgi:hypothetical protein